MTYRTIMVHVDVGSKNDNVLTVAATLGARFQSHVIGIAASQPIQLIYSDGYVPGDIVADEAAELKKETVDAEASFRAVLQGQCVELSWRSATNRAELADYIVQEARAADLLITGPDTGWSAFDTSRRIVVSDVVLRIGRPVLIVPHTVGEMRWDSVVIGWKETREARRVVLDALPLLKQASCVSIVEIVNGEENVAGARKRLADVVEWLGRHGVSSQDLALVSTGDDAAQLQQIAKDKEAGLVVAGAYGHSRLREWVLGGVTRDLLSNSGLCSLVSH